MRVPALLLFTNLRAGPNPVPDPVAVRPDLVATVERASVNFEERPVKGVGVVKAANSVEATCIFLVNGRQVLVEETVEEVRGACERALRPGLLARLFS